RFCRGPRGNRMGIVNWRGMPVATGDEWAGVGYFTTLRLSTAQEASEPVRPNPGYATGASSAPYDTFNLGAHVGDTAQAVAANRARLASVLPDAPLWLEQVHGTHVFD